MGTPNFNTIRDKTAAIDVPIAAVLKIAAELQLPELKPTLEILSGAAVLSEMNVTQLTLGFNYMLRFCYHLGKMEERLRCAELLLTGDIFKAVTDKELLENVEDEEQRIRVFASAAIKQGI